MMRNFILILTNFHLDVKVPVEAVIARFLCIWVGVMRLGNRSLVCESSAFSTFPLNEFLMFTISCAAYGSWSLCYNYTISRLNW